MKHFHLLLIVGLFLAGLTACHAQSTAAPAPATDPNATAFQKNASSVTSAEVIVAAPTNDPLDAALASFGGFPASADVNHVHRPVTHSFAVGYDAKGNAVEAVYFNDQGQPQVTTDPDLLATYQHKAHKLVDSAPAGASASDAAPDHSGPFVTSGGGTGGGSSSSGHSSATIHGKDIEVGMSKAEVRKKLGPPTTVFDEGTDHETWVVKPLDPGHKIVDSAITEVASGFGIFATTVQAGGAKVNSPEKSYNIRFSGDTVSRVSVDSSRQ